MWSWRYNKELKEKYFAEYCKTQSQTKYLMYTYYERNTDAEAKELQKIGLLDKYRNYTFWDNFPDNWKLSDEELEAFATEPAIAIIFLFVVGIGIMVHPVFSLILCARLTNANTLDSFLLCAAFALLSGIWNSGTE